MNKYNLLFCLLLIVGTLAIGQEKVIESGNYIFKNEQGIYAVGEDKNGVQVINQYDLNLNFKNSISFENLKKEGRKLFLFGLDGYASWNKVFTDLGDFFVLKVVDSDNTFSDYAYATLTKDLTVFDVMASRKFKEWKKLNKMQLKDSDNTYCIDHLNIFPHCVKGDDIYFLINEFKNPALMFERYGLFSGFPFKNFVHKGNTVLVKCKFYIDSKLGQIMLDKIWEKDLGTDCQYKGEMVSYEDDKLFMKVPSSSGFANFYSFSLKTEEVTKLSESIEHFEYTIALGAMDSNPERIGLPQEIVLIKNKSTNSIYVSSFKLKENSLEQDLYKLDEKKVSLQLVETNWISAAQLSRSPVYYLSSFQEVNKDVYVSTMLVGQKLMELSNNQGQEHEIIGFVDNRISEEAVELQYYSQSDILSLTDGFRGFENAFYVSEGENMHFGYSKDKVTFFSPADGDMNLNSSIVRKSKVSNFKHAEKLNSRTQFVNCINAADGKKVIFIIKKEDNKNEYDIFIENVQP